MTDGGAVAGHDHSHAGVQAYHTALNRAEQARGPTPDDLIRGPRTDPVRIGSIVDRWEIEIRKTLRELRGLIRAGIVDRDVLRLSERNQAGAGAVQAAMDPLPRFPYAGAPELAEGFEDWLDTQYTRGVIQGISHDQYIRAAYQRGVDHADYAMVRAGIIPEPDSVADLFNVPVHREAVGLLHNRTMDNVQSIGGAVRTEVSRELARGIIAGDNPRTMARNINDRVDKVARWRLEMVARSETAYAQSEATLTRFQQQGVDEVGVVAEFTTAGDDRVCSECLTLEGSRFDLKEARGLIPVHPNCRCAWVPISNREPTSRNAGRLSPVEARHIVRTNQFYPATA